MQAKLRDAGAILCGDIRPVKERLRAAYFEDLALLEPDLFPNSDARDEFRAIKHAFNRYGELGEGVGSVATTLFTMSDEEAEALANRVLDLADRHLR